MYVLVVCYQIYWMVFFKEHHENDVPLPSYTTLAIWAKMTDNWNVEWTNFIARSVEEAHYVLLIVGTTTARHSFQQWNNELKLAQVTSVL